MLLPFWCTICHWLRLIMKIIYCVSGFPSMCYMTWGVRARINLFTVACSCFVSTSSSEIQVWSKIMGFQKKERKKKSHFSFVFLNVYASVYIEKSIVFKRVGVKDVCASVFLGFQPASLFCPVCSCTKDCNFSAVSWLLVFCPKWTKLACFFFLFLKHATLNYFHVDFFPHAQ